MLGNIIYWTFRVLPPDVHILGSRNT